MTTNRTLSLVSLALLSSLSAFGCTPTQDLGMYPDDEGSGGSSSDGGLTGDGSGGGSYTSAGDVATDDTGGGEETGALQLCGELGVACCGDEDRDMIPFPEDNGPGVYNPGQADRDGDGAADIIDLCPTLADESGTQAADSDRDGVGNACDRCRQAPVQYNEVFEGEGALPYMLVRNIPTNADMDGDGIGDACDNCPTVANCGEFNADNPHVLGQPLPWDDDIQCQTDTDGNGVGDACEDLQLVTAAGPTGLGPEDDQDQDGLRNEDDACPRLPLSDAILCSAAAPCPDGRVCTQQGVCNHVDTDGDGVGNRCDTCREVANPSQFETTGVNADDPDGDFIGDACESITACEAHSDPRETSFHTVSAYGDCCVQLLVADEATGDLSLARGCEDADGCRPLLTAAEGQPELWIPLRVVCTAQQQTDNECRPLPPSVASTPGVLAPPAGCDQALAAAGVTAVQNLQSPVIEDDAVGEPYDFACLMPLADNDFDGLGDVCDLCPQAFDPSNAAYVDDNGKLWPNNGGACNGEFVCVSD